MPEFLFPFSFPPPPFLSRVNNFQLCILWMCFHASFFHNIERAHFQIPDVLFIYSEASGPRQGLVTATWQTCEKSELQAVNKLYYTGKWWEQFKGERKRGAGGVEMKKEQISCLATLCFLRLQMTSGTQIGNWGFCSSVNRALKTLKLNRSSLGWLNTLSQLLWRASSSGMMLQVLCKLMHPLKDPWE